MGCLCTAVLRTKILDTTSCNLLMWIPPMKWLITAMFMYITYIYIHTEYTVYYSIIYIYIYIVIQYDIHMWYGWYTCRSSNGNASCNARDPSLMNDSERLNLVAWWQAASSHSLGVPLLPSSLDGLFHGKIIEFRMDVSFGYLNKKRK